MTGGRRAAPPDSGAATRENATRENGAWERAARPRSWQRPVAMLGLVGVAAVFGATFLAVKDAVARMPVFDFLAWRFVIAAVLMIAARPRSLRSLDARGMRYGILLGAALGSAYIVQTIGLQHTPAAVSGFITGLFVVFTPVLSWLLLRRRLGVMAWLAVLLAGAGLALITLGGFALSAGELLTLACAVFFALHIVGLGEWSPGRDSWALTVMQMAAVAAACTACALITGQLGVPRGTSEWFAILLTAVLASAVAYGVQTWAQSRLTATEVAVVLTMEPVFAALFAVVVGGEALGAAAIIGGVLVVAAMYLVELRS